RFSRELAAELNVEMAQVTDLAAAACQSDICVTCTPSHAPLLGPDDVRPGAFVAAIGADNPHKQEIYSGLMAKSKIICDVVEQCAMMGDLHHALVVGVMSIDNVHAELGAIVAGQIIEVVTQ